MGISEGCNMIIPERFYSDSDRLSPDAKKRMWRKIKSEIKPRHTSIRLTIHDKRSFLYGMAAAMLIFFVTAGIISTIRNAFERSQPQAVKLDAAYMTAIREFEKVAPDANTPKTDSAGISNINSVRRDELNNIDAAIQRLQADAISGDLSPLRQQRLRKLYSMKLNILQEMIENGEIEL
jgi:hypothetical protein